MKFYLSSLIMFGSLSLCQAQGVFSPGESSALSGWESSRIAIDNAAVVQAAFVRADVINSPALPGAGETFAPNISPEPSTCGLLLAGAGVLLRFGARKRSN